MNDSIDALMFALNAIETPILKDTGMLKQSINHKKHMKGYSIELEQCSLCGSFGNSKCDCKAGIPNPIQSMIIKSN